MENKEKSEMKQGQVIMEAPMEVPIEFRNVHGKYILQLTNRNETLMLDADYMTLKEVKALVVFIESVYRSGFVDGSQAAMNINKPKPKMFAITPDETGYDSYFVMSDTKENAIESLKNNERCDSYLRRPDKYTITEHELNDSVWHENA